MSVQQAIVAFAYAVDVCGLAPVLATGAAVAHCYPSDLAKADPTPAVYFVVERDQEPGSVTVLRRTGSYARQTLAHGDIDQQIACASFFIYNDGAFKACRIHNGPFRFDLIQATMLRTETLGDVWKINCDL